MAKMFDGLIAGLRIYHRALGPMEVYKLYCQERFLYMTWYQRLWYWVKVTWMILIGIKTFNPADSE